MTRCCRHSRARVQASLTPELCHMLALDDPLNDAVSANVATAQRVPMNAPSDGGFVPRRSFRA